jgi:hypothetical protein
LAFTARLPDRVLAIKAEASGITALTHDGSLTTLDAAGKFTATKPFTPTELEEARRTLVAAANPAVEAAAKKQARTDRMFKLASASASAADGGGNLAVAYWGGTLRIVDDKGAVKTEQQLPQDITALAWSGGRLYVGLADGQVVALLVK